MFMSAPRYTGTYTSLVQTWNSINTKILIVLLLRLQGNSPPLAELLRDSKGFNTMWKELAVGEDQCGNLT